MRKVLLFTCVLVTITLSPFMIKNVLARHMIGSFLKDTGVSVDMGQEELEILQSNPSLRDVYIYSPPRFSDNCAIWKVL